MAFSNTDTISLLNRLGLRTVEERGMRIFPLSGRSADVRDTLVSYLRKSGIQKSCRYPAVRTDLMLRYLDSRIK